MNVVSDAVRPLDEAQASAFLDEIADAGGKLVTTDEVTASRSKA